MGHFYLSKNDQCPATAAHPLVPSLMYSVTGNTVLEHLRSTRLRSGAQRSADSERGPPAAPYFPSLGGAAIPEANDRRRASRARGRAHHRLRGRTRTPEGSPPSSSRRTRTSETSVGRAGSPVPPRSSHRLL